MSVELSSVFWLKGESGKMFLISVWGGGSKSRTPSLHSGCLTVVCFMKKFDTFFTTDQP